MEGGDGARGICVQRERHTLQIHAPRGSTGRAGWVVGVLGVHGGRVERKRKKKLLKMTAIKVSISITLQKSPTGQPYGRRHFAYCLEITGTLHSDLTKHQENIQH